MAEMWNQVLTRENIADFYNSTVTMVYPSVYDITKETTRAENAIVKSYQDIYSKRESVAGEDVIYVFGDILLKNAKDIVEMYPLPENLNFAPRLLDEYTRNSMLEKIITRIDSKSFKVAEFISSDSHKQSSPSSLRKYMDVFPITPLLIVEILFVSLIIWFVCLAATKIPFSSDKLINEQAIFEQASLQEKYVSAMGYYPLNADINKSFVNKDSVAASVTDNTAETSESVNSSTSESGEAGEPGEGNEAGEEGEDDFEEGDEGDDPDQGGLVPSTGTTAGTEASATRG